MPIALLPLFFACTGDTLDSAGDSSGTTEPVDEWEQIQAAYGTLDTLAGKGDYPDKGYNGWNTSYEGGDALSAELSRPHMTMADDAGYLYIADKDAHAVRRVDPEGIITTIAGTGSSGDDGDAAGQGTELRLASPNGLWAQPDGTVYIHDMGNDKVRKLTTDGVMTTLFEVADSGTGRGLWVAEDESLAYVSCGNNIKSWTPEGGARTLATGFSSLGNLVVDPDGLVVATDRGGHTVTRIHEDGTEEVIAGTGTSSGGGDGELATETGLSEVRGIWFHPLGGYFLATHSGGQVWYVDTEGVIHLFLDGDESHSHSGDGERYDTPGKKISEPRAITIDADGRLLITENDHGYVRVIWPAD